MLRTYYGFFLFFLLAINFLTIDSRSIFENNIESIVNDNHRKLSHAFTGYRHRFEQSANFKALRWNLRNIQIAGLCELCDLGVPLVSSCMDFQF
jgi:hypothetical protein